MMVVQSCGSQMMDGSHPHTVLSHLSEQRSHGLFCDVTIVVEDIKFRAHRNILSATSRYFHNAFTTSPSYMPSQVLEIPDLKSEVFSVVLDFIYSSRVESGAEDCRSIAAAGKKLGIPFLEKLIELEQQKCEVIQNQTFAKSESSSSQAKPAGFCKPKNEVQRVEEQECSKGPRITNAFSITEVPEVNNPFTPLDLGSDGHQSPGNPSAEGESVDAVSEHSYAVSKGHQATEGREKDKAKPLQTEKRSIKPAAILAKNLSSHRLGPLKKRHRRLLAAVSMETSTEVQNGPPDSTSSDPVADLCAAPDLLPPPEILPSQDTDPPSLVPEDVPSSTTYRCLQCPEAFSSATLLAIHAQGHKRRFVSHLFCKYCRKKFIHLKRLRNHEQVCVKGPPELEPSNENLVPLERSPGEHDLREPPTLDQTITGTSELPALLPPPEDGAVKPRARQRMYKCGMCKRAYVTLSSLKRHENVHSWQRAYPCHYCNKVFALAEYRTKHEIWHTGERRYQCIFCLETFLTYYILRNHQKSFHGIDPRLTVNKKSANGGFKGSVYPIKLYRLLPMKFRKKRYKTYSHTYSDMTDGHENSFTAPLDAVSHVTDPVSNSDSAVAARSLFSMPVTFMATPKMMATEMPRITFEQIQETASPSDKSTPLIGQDVFPHRSVPTGFEETPVFGYGYTPPPQTTSGADLRSGGNSSQDVLPFLNIPPVCSFEGLSKLSELSAAAQTIEAMANQLLQPPAESPTHSLRPDGKTETYIAKPACPGPSVDSPVLPLCQITVKIGDEAIIRRKIKGSKLFPKKKKQRAWLAQEDQNMSEDGVGFPNLRLRTDLTSSVTEDEPCDDANDPENDKLWRPYYSYKPKRKGKRVRSRQKRAKNIQYYTKPLSPEPDEDQMMTEKDCAPEESIPTRRLSESEPDLTCRRCGRSFLTRSSLGMHIVSCHQPRCGTCAKLCPMEELHNADAAEGYVCRACTENGSCFSSDMTSHSLSSEKRYRCSYCPQRFLYLATKKSHEAKHLEKFREEHSCRFCHKVCKSAAVLSLHESKHFPKVKELQSPENSKPYSPLPDRKEKPEPEPDPWPSSKISPFTRRLEETREKGDDGTYPKISSRKQAPFSYSCKSDRSSFLPDMQGDKTKRKSFLELSKDFSLESADQNPLKIALSNRFKLRPPRPPAANALQPPKLEWRMFKQEPYD